MSTIKLPTKLVKAHFALTLKQEQKNFVDYILDELKELSVEHLMLDPDFWKYLAEIIENQVNKKAGDAPDTKILKRIFPHITDADIVTCRGMARSYLSQY